jgi:hypothetical protein
MSLNRPLKIVSVNPSRRDLIKQLVAAGALGASGLLRSATLQGENLDKTTNALASNTTWKKDEDYESLRRAMMWSINTPGRYPDVIVQASSSQEIQQALKFAQDNDLQVVCRSVGHNEAGAVLRNGGMLLDLSPMSGISVDTQQMTAQIQPSLNSYYCYQKLAEYGLTFPLADCHGVAMAGYLMGGGLSPSGFVWGNGPACYSVISADVILANGEKVVASKNENTDLYWAIRGVGPGFFGVVTDFKLQLYKHPETIMKSTFMFPLDALPNVISILDNMLPAKDRRVSTRLSLMKEPGSANTIMARLKIIVFATDHGDSESEAKNLLRPYAQSKLSTLSMAQELEQVIQYTDLMYTPDRNYRLNSNNIWTNDSSALLAIIDHYKTIPAGLMLYLSLLHGGNSGTQREDACYSSVGRHFVSGHLLWKDAKKDEEYSRWFKELNDILSPFATSHYVNQLSNDQDPSRVRASFSAENWQKLAAVRKKYDPDNRFFTYLGF